MTAARSQRPAPGSAAPACGRPSLVRFPPRAGDGRSSAAASVDLAKLRAETTRRRRAARVAEMKRMQTEGQTQAEIGAALGVSQSTVSLAMRSAGLGRSAARLPPMSEKDKSFYQKLRAMGYSRGEALGLIGAPA